MKLSVNKIGLMFEWGRSPVIPELHSFYVGVDLYLLPWNWELAFERIWYDGPHASLRLGPIWFSWSTPRTKPPKEFRKA